MKLKSLLLSAALFAGTVGCSPSPEAVCDKIFDLSKAQGVEKSLPPREQCLKAEARAKEFKGAIKYSKSRGCIMSAKTLNDLNSCSKKS
jgi:hypothetical protein